MSTEVPEHSLEDSTVDSPSERRQSGFTAVNEYRDPLSDGRPRQISETTEALPHNVQPPYAPTGPDQRREEWTTAQLSPVSQKRKRSISMERSPRSQTTGKRRSSQEEGATGLYTETAHSHTGEQTQHYTVHEASQTQMEALAAAHYSETQAEAWASQQEQHQHPAAAHMNDAQLAAVLQRETQLGSHPHTLGALGASPEQRFPVADTTQQRQVEGAAPLTPQMDAPHLQKQRKRNFSNRTKTGCLTCRERKKKCDEGKPTCNNCERGGFMCKGYSQQAPVYKPPTAMYRDPPVLQSKNGYEEAPIPYSYPARSVSEEYYAEPQQVVAATGQVSVGEAREQSVRQISSPQEAHGRSASARPPWPETGGHSQVQAHHVRHSPDDESRPEYSQTPRMPEQSQDQSREQKKLAHSSTSIHPPTQNRSSSLPPHQYNDQRITAQLALQHPSAGPTPSAAPIARPATAMTPMVPTASVYTSEKEKMLAGHPYQHSDVRLKRERQRCSLAVHNFNKTALQDPNIPNDDEQRIAQFRQILQPQQRSPSTSSPNNSAADLPGLAGHIGERVEVTAPFACDYGYNIRIEDDVEISSGCTVIDACPVFIGARTFIGPDVSIYTVDGDHHRTVPLTPGLKRPCVAAPVVIEEDCWIGGRVVIMPGVTIGKGSTIAAGTLLYKDVPSHAIVHTENSLRMEHNHPS